jgi:hypothetical protein
LFVFILRRSSRGGAFNSSSKICLILCIPNLKDEQRPKHFPVISLFFQLVFNEIMDIRPVAGILWAQVEDYETAMAENRGRTMAIPPSSGRGARDA